MHTLKAEEVDGKAYRSREDAESKIGAFIDDVYNARRLHSSIGYKPPIEFEHEFRQAQKREANQPTPVYRISRVSAEGRSPGLYYCFGTCSKGGDAITMAANVRNCSLREAAEFLDGKGGGSAAAAKGDSSRNNSPSPRQRTGSGRLITFRPRMRPCRPWACRRRRQRTSGRASLPRASCADGSPFPIHDPAGILLAYCGRAVKDESPLLLFPNGFDPRIAIFNANRIVEGDLFLVRDPLQVLTAHESGIENVVAFLTENVTALQLEQLAALMDERKCEHLEMF